jgi:hypothetical protein
MFATGYILLQPTKIFPFRELSTIPIASGTSICFSPHKRMNNCQSFRDSSQAPLIHEARYLGLQLEICNVLHFHGLQSYDWGEIHTPNFSLDLELKVSNETQSLLLASPER